MGGRYFYLGACTQGKIYASHLVRTESPTHTEVRIFLIFVKNKTQSFTGESKNFNELLSSKYYRPPNILCVSKPATDNIFRSTNKYQSVKIVRLYFCLQVFCYLCIMKSF
jgi:hypothetical protein